MKTTIVALFTVLIGVSLEVSARSKEDIERFGWPMFKRTDIVTLHDKQIPDEYKRNKIIDAKGRVLKGEWLEINRKSKVVKFRRTDGKEFDIAFTDLCERDRRYAELETGYAWNIGEKPPVPKNLIYFHPKDQTIPSPIKVVINTIPKDEISAAEMVGKDTVRVTVKYGKPRSEELTKTTDLPVNLLTENDRAVIKAATNLEVPVLPRPAWSKENAKYWVDQEIKIENGQTVYSGIIYHFVEPMPVFKPDHVARDIPIFTTAWAGMNEQFTPEEIYDHIRVRTLTSDFIYKYCNYQSQIKGNQSRTTKPLAEVMQMLADAEPTKERVSLKADIQKSGVRLFEEKTPREEVGKPKFDGPNDPPMDGELQAYHFIAQYKSVTSGKPKIPFENTFKNSSPMLVSTINGPGHLEFVGNRAGAVGKTFAFKIWAAPYFGSADSVDIFKSKVIRHHIRHNQPVFVGQNNGFAILTGFTIEPGKEATYDAIMLDGPKSGSQVSSTNLPYKVYEKNNVKSSEFNMYEAEYFFE